MASYLRFHVLLSPEPAAAGDLAVPRLRRVLGRALIARHCPFGEPRCQQHAAGGAPPAAELCCLASTCPYGVLFAASHGGRPPFALHLPRPRPGGADVIELTLFGAACQLFHWGLAALQDALRRGLGKQRRPREIARVWRVRPDRRRELLCDRDLARLPAALAPDRVRLALDPEAPPRPVQVELLSPARLLCDGKLLAGRAPLTFPLLVARTLDRCAGLFGGDFLPADEQARLTAAAARVELVADQTRWLEVRDYSARQRSELLLGGKVGRVVYGAAAAPFLPLLRAAEALHVGKNPTAGCGRLAADLMEVGP